MALKGYKGNWGLAVWLRKGVTSNFLSPKQSCIQSSKYSIYTSRYTGLTESAGKTVLFLLLSCDNLELLLGYLSSSSVASYLCIYIYTSKYIDSKEMFLTSDKSFKLESVLSKVSTEIYI